MDLITRMLAALNARDVDAASALFHENYRSEQPAHPGRAFIGRAQMHANWTAIFTGIPDFRAQLRRSVRDGDVLWCEWVWSGTRTDGLAFESRGVTLFQVEGEFIVAGRLYMQDVETDRIGIEQVVEEISGERPRHLSGGDGA